MLMVGLWFRASLWLAACKWACLGSRLLQGMFGASGLGFSACLGLGLPLSRRLFKDFVEGQYLDTEKS